MLGAIESGVEFEKRIAAIYQNCRTTAEIESEFERLQQEMEANITATMTDTRKKLLENFDADVHDRLRVNLTESREYLNKFDTMLWKLTCFGSDEQDHLLPVAITDREEILSEDTARRFFDLPATIITIQKVTLPKKLQAETQMREQAILKNLEARQAVWFDEEIEKLNYWADDKRKGLKTELKEFDDEIALLKKEARVAPNLPDKLTIQKKLRDIDKKRDTAWKEYDEAAKKIEKQKDELLDSVEERLKQTIHEKSVFNIRWNIV